MNRNKESGVEKKDWKKLSISLCLSSTVHTPISGCHLCITMSCDQESDHGAGHAAWLGLVLNHFCQLYGQ